MNLRVILFLLAVVVLILCVTGAKVKNNNMQKLIKCSVPLVLFMTLILCMSKNVEPYCDVPARDVMEKYNQLSDASKDVVNQASPIRNDRMGFGPNMAVNNWRGSECNNKSGLWSGSPLTGTGGFELPTGQTISDQSIAMNCSTACNSKALRDNSSAGDSNESVDYGSGSEAAVCLQNLRNATDSSGQPVYTPENFGRAPFMSRYINSSGEVSDPGRGPGLLQDVCNRLKDAPSAEDRECLGLDLGTTPGTSGYEMSCPGLSSAFETAVNNEYGLDCDEAWSGCNKECSRTLIDNYRGIGSCVEPSCTAGEGACPRVLVPQDINCVLGPRPNPDNCTTCGQILTQNIETPAQGTGNCPTPETHTCGPGDGDCPLSAQNVDCQGRWRCDSDCRPQFTELVARMGSGAACPTAPICTGGMDDCPRIVPAAAGAVTFSHESLPIEGTTFTLYKMYVNLDTSVHRNMYALAFRDPQDQFPRITKSTNVIYSSGSLTTSEAASAEALIEINTLGNASNIMNGVSSLPENINDALIHSSFITISEPAAGSAPSKNSMSYIGLNEGEWMNGQEILRGSDGPTGGALFYMNPSDGPSPSDGRVFIGQLLIDQNDPDWSSGNTLPVSFTAQGESLNVSDWQAQVTGEIQKQTGRIESGLEVGISEEAGDSLRRISCFYHDGNVSGETCAANQGCGPIDRDVIQGVRDSSYAALYSDANFAELELMGLQQTIADELGRPVSDVETDIGQIDCSQPILMP